MNFKAFSEDDLELIMLRLVLLGDINNIKLFSYSISDEKRIQILKSLVTSQPPTIYTPTKLVPSSLNLKWIASRLLLSEGYTDFPSVNFEGLGLIDFANMSDAITQFFKFSFSRVDNRPSDESKIISFAESFLQFYSKRLSVADFLLKTEYSSYIMRVPLPKLFRNFQFRCFILINDNLNKVDLSTLDVNFSNYNDYQPFKDLYQIYRGYQKEDFFPTIQKMILNDKLFPNTIGNDSERMVRSLIDTSLLKSNHFVEVLRDYSYFLFKERRIEESIEKAKIIKGIEPWIFMSHYYRSIKELSPTSLPSIEETVRFFQSMNYEHFENGEKSIAADFLNRLQNDNSFFAMIRQNTGQTINSSMLYEHSIPFFLILFLKLADPLPFKDLNEIHLFVVNDEDRLKDADFVWSYFAEVVAINALTKPDEAEDMIAQSGWYLSQINHSKIHHEVLIDIFSILFLQQEIDKKPKYVCYQSVAEIILTMILGMSDDDPSLMQQAQNGHLLIQFARSISNGVDFEDLIFPKEQQLLKAFQNEDWLIADHIAALNVHLSDMNILYKTVNEYLKKSKFHDLLFSSKEKVESFVEFLFDPSKSKSKFASVEIGLSFPDQIDALKASLNISPILSESLDLIKQRYQILLKKEKKKKSCNNYTTLLRAVKTLKDEDFALIKQNFSDLNSTKWNLSPFTYEQKEMNSENNNDDNNHLHLLKSFLFYLDSLVGVVLNDEKLVENVSEALNGDPSLFVNKLFNKGSVSSAEKVSKVIKQDMMLMFASNDSASDDLIEQVSNENLPYALTLALSKEDGIKANPIHDKNSIAYKIANLALKSNERRKEQIDMILRKSRKTEMNLNDNDIKLLKLKELKEIFDNELLTNNFDIEKVVNISYSLDSDSFSNFVLKYININNKYLSKIIELVDCCCSINSKLYDSAMFLKAYLDSHIEIYPFENLFVYLLNNKKYKEASKFIHLLGDKIHNYKDHLIEAYSNEIKNKINSKYEILNISPENKDEIESKAILLISHNLNNENSSNNEFIEEIEDDSFDDLLTIKEKLIQNPEGDFDNEIFNSLLFYSEINIFAFCTTFRKAIYLVKNTNKLIDYSISVFENFISQIFVNSNQIEDETWQILDKINSVFEKHVLSHIDDLNNERVSLFMKKISIMKSVVDHSPFNLFQIEYNFFDFGKNLSFIFPKLDLINNLLTYNSIFDIPTSELNIDSYILNCCQIGITDFQVPFKIEQSRFNEDEKTNKNYHCKRSLYEKVALLLTPEKYFYENLLVLTFMNQFPPNEEMLNLLQKENKNTKNMIEQQIREKQKIGVNYSSSSSFLDINASNNDKTATTSTSLPSILFTGAMSNDHFFKRIEFISSKESSSTFEIEPMKKVKDFFKESAPIDIVISYFTLKGDLASAINLIEESGKRYDKKFRQELFKNSFFEKVISRPDDINRVLTNVMTIDRDLLVSVLLESCPYLRFDVYSLLKEWKEAYKAATDVFCIPTSDSNEARLRQLNLLTWMENCLEKITEKTDEIELSKIQVTLQKEVCHFAIDNNLQCNFSETNLFKNELQKESVVIFLMTHFNIRLAIAVLRFFELNRFRIGERSCDIFINEDMKNITLFFKKFQKEIDINIFREIFYAICLRMKFVLEVDQELILAYINIVEDREFKRKLLYQFDFLKEAADIAFQDDDIDMVVSIANDAYVLQLNSLLSKCNKFIEKKSKLKQ